MAPSLHPSPDPSGHPLPSGEGWAHRRLFDAFDAVAVLVRVNSASPDRVVGPACDLELETLAVAPASMARIVKGPFDVSVERTAFRGIRSY